jgi:hypothetical protein
VIQASARPAKLRASGAADEVDLGGGRDGVVGDRSAVEVADAQAAVVVDRGDAAVGAEGEAGGGGGRGR